MARVVDPVRYGERRHAILDATAQLIIERGPDAVTIAAVLDSAGVSKGAFYHYFRSKEQLLRSLVVARLDAWAIAVDAAVEGIEDPDERLVALLRSLTIAKTGDLALLVGALPHLHVDGNAALHGQLRISGARRFLPVLTDTIAMGARSGRFTASSPPAAAKVVLSLLQELGACASRDLLAIVDGAATSDELRADVRAYAAAIPAVLGAPVAPERIVAPDELDAWIDAAAETLGPAARRAGGDPRRAL